MEKTNIAELLKDCPKDMELDCSIHTRPVIFNCVKMESDYPIRISSKDGFNHSLTYWGSIYNCKDAKCVIFPKGKTTWEGFQRPFVDGDIVVSCIGKPFILKFYDLLNNNVHSYCGVDCNNGFHLSSSTWTVASGIRHADEEEKQKLFNAIKENGYHWNTETKTLEKLPKFKVGDRIKAIGFDRYNIIKNIESDRYILDKNGFLKFNDEHYFELVLNKFDITTLKPFDSRVLVRDYSYQIWRVSFWGCLINNECGYIYDTTRGCYKQCIPFEGNEHLLGKTDDCDNFYKIWE